MRVYDAFQRLAGKKIWRESPVKVTPHVLEKDAVGPRRWAQMGEQK